MTARKRMLMVAWCCFMPTLTYPSTVAVQQARRGAREPVAGFSTLLHVRLDKGPKWNPPPAKESDHAVTATGVPLVVVGFGNLDDTWDQVPAPARLEIIILVEARGDGIMEFFVNDIKLWEYEAKAPGIDLSPEVRLEDYIRSPVLDISKYVRKGDRFRLTVRTPRGGFSGYYVNNLLIVGR